jgi:Flp pilus assembly protein TadD
VIVAALAACSYRQVGTWRNSDTLWSHAISIDATNDAAHVAYAQALFAENRTSEGLEHLRRAVELRPANAGRYGGGALGLDEQQLDAGIRFWAQRAEERPTDPGAKDSLGALLIQKHRTREAIAMWEQALALDANDGNAQANLAWALATCPDETVRDGNRALDLAQKASQLAGGRNALVARTVAAALAESGRFDEAITTAREAQTIATEEGNNSLAEDLDRILTEFEAHRPLRDEAMQPARDLH